jgi:hypothetical protein
MPGQPGQKGPGGFMGMLNSKVGNKVPGGAGTLLGVGAGVLGGAFLAHEWEEHEDRERMRPHGFGGLGGLMGRFGGGSTVTENVTVDETWTNNNTFGF